MDQSLLDDVLLDAASTTSSDNDDVTAAQVVEMLQEAWTNEKLCPELLPHKIEIVDCLLGQIHHMEANIACLPKSDFQYSLHQLEVDRIRFMVCSYLRIRLEKIEAGCRAILSEEQKRAEPYLTPAEAEFARKHLANQEQLYRSILGRHGIECHEDILPANHRGYVLLRAKRAVEGISVTAGAGNNPEDEGEDLVDLMAGSQMLLNYDCVKDLLKDGSICLI